MVQIARPDSLISAGSWITPSGSSLFGAIGEVIASDTDYDESAPSPTTVDIMEVSLSDVLDPVSAVNHDISYRYGKNAALGDTINLTVRLREGVTNIATWTHSDISATPATVTQTLSSGEANSITDYSDLRLRFEGVKP